MKENKLIIGGITWLFAVQLNILVTSFTTNMVQPISIKVTKKNLDDQVITVFGIRFKIGAFLKSLLDFTIIIIIIYFILQKFNKLYNYSQT